MGNSFLDDVSKANRPEPNVGGSFDCMECRETVSGAHYDRTTGVLRWWCSKDHESVMKEVNIS